MHVIPALEQGKINKKINALGWSDDKGGRAGSLYSAVV